ncbi:hypothetical protein F5Y08DRAFT_245482 [Xylaria arbuscula]|nr:hypothetical protein F5Y08DRAFT_245482 [Xylaria arbuscula]
MVYIRVRERVVVVLMLEVCWFLLSPIKPTYTVSLCILRLRINSRQWQLKIWENKQNPESPGGQQALDKNARQRRNRRGSATMPCTTLHYFLSELVPIHGPWPKTPKVGRACKVRKGVPV